VFAAAGVLFSCPLLCVPGPVATSLSPLGAVEGGVPAQCDCRVSSIALLWATESLRWPVAMLCALFALMAILYVLCGCSVVCCLAPSAAQPARWLSVWRVFGFAFCCLCWCLLSCLDPCCRTTYRVWVCDTVCVCVRLGLSLFRYYSLVLLTNVILATHLGDPSEAESSSTAPTPGCQVLSDAGYFAALVVNASELPGLMVAMWGLDRLGRRATIAYACLGCAAACGVMLGAGAGAVTVLPLFVARACALAFNQSLWILSCEVGAPRSHHSSLVALPQAPPLGPLSACQSPHAACDS
jgi:hypothetical protein